MVRGLKSRCRMFYVGLLLWRPVELDGGLGQGFGGKFMDSEMGCVSSAEMGVLQ